jgi:hypothetical protein
MVVHKLVGESLIVLNCLFYKDNEHVSNQWRQARTQEFFKGGVNFQGEHKGGVPPGV